MKASTSFLALAATAACLVPSAVAFSTVKPAGAQRTTAAATTTALSMAGGPNPVIKVAAQGMSLLKPIFKLEAQAQAAAFGAIANIDKEAVAAEVASTIQTNKVLIYTYGLSPFSSEAVSMLKASGYDFTKLELGAEWFVLGGKASEIRVLLAQQVENGATSLPKIFIGGTCIGGCAELAALVENEELDAIMKQAGVSKKGEKKKTAAFSLFN